MLKRPCLEKKGERYWAFKEPIWSDPAAKRKGFRKEVIPGELTGTLPGELVS